MAIQVFWLLSGITRDLLGTFCLFWRMTAFGNAKLDGRHTLEERDLPDAGARKSSIGFVQ